MSLFLQLFANGIIQGAIVACLAVGFGIVYRSFRVFHIALGAQFVFSCYAIYGLVTVLAWRGAIAIVGTLFLSVAFAWLIEFAVYRPFYRKRCTSGVLMIASLGILIVVENLIALCFGNEVKTISTSLQPSVTLGVLRFTHIQMIQLVVGLGLFGGLGVSVQKGRHFMAVWAMGDQAELIPVLGLPFGKLRLMVMAISGIMIAVPAMLVSYDIGMDPRIGMHYLLLASVAVFFGGVDRYWAWGVGAIVLCSLQSLTVWKFSTRWINLVTFGVLIFVLLFRPQGLLGTQKRLEEG